MTNNKPRITSLEEDIRRYHEDGGTAEGLLPWLDDNSRVWNSDLSLISRKEAATDARRIHRELTGKPEPEPEPAEPEPEPGLTGMAAQAADFQAANPDLILHLIPLRDGGTPKLEGKVPIPDNWQTCGGVPFDHPSWRDATGYGIVLTDNRQVVIFDIDGDLTEDAAKALDKIPGLRYKTKKGFHLLTQVPATSGLPSMNSLKEYGDENWGQIFHYAKRQVALCGSKNKQLPSGGNLTIPSAPTAQVKNAIDTLLAQPKAGNEAEAEADNKNGQQQGGGGTKYDPEEQYHQWLLNKAASYAYTGWNYNRIYAKLATSRSQKTALKHRPDTADNDLRRIIEGAIRLAAKEEQDTAKFLPLPAARNIINELTIATDNGGQPWRYKNGIYIEENTPVIIRRKVETLIAELNIPYNPKHAREVLEIIGGNTLPKIGQPEPNTLVLANGTLDIKNPENPVLRDWTPNDYATAKLPVAYEEETECPKFVKFLNEAWAGETEQTIAANHRLLAQAIGACLADEIPPKGAIYFLAEKKNTGKSTLCYIITRLIGQENVAQVSPTDLEEDKWAAYRLFGKKANIVPDIPVGVIKDPSRFKMITGGNDLITADRKYLNAVSFYNQAVSIFGGNKRPASYDNTAGWFARLIPLRFNNEVPPNRIDPNLPDRIIQEEAAGILNYALTGLADLYATGWKWAIPQATLEAQQGAYQAANLPLLWADTQTRPDPNGWLPQADIGKEYARWLREEGHLDDDEKLDNKMRRKLYAALDEAWHPRHRRATGPGWAYRSLTGTLH